MKIKIISLIVLLFLGGTLSVKAQDINAKPTAAPTPINLPSLPDLRITHVTINVGKMDVEATNRCKGSAPHNRLRLTIYSGADKNSGAGDVLEGDVPALNGGAKATVTFDLKVYGSKYSSFGDKYYRLEVDFYNTVKETSEENNWWEKSTIPFPDGANSCGPAPKPPVNQ